MDERHQSGPKARPLKPSGAFFPLLCLALAVTGCEGRKTEQMLAGAWLIETTETRYAEDDRVVFEKPIRERYRCILQADIDEDFLLSPRVREPCEVRDYRRDAHSARWIMHCTHAGDAPSNDRWHATAYAKTASLEIWREHQLEDPFAKTETGESVPLTLRDRTLSEMRHVGDCQTFSHLIDG